jgi:hypothetical protein
MRENESFLAPVRIGLEMQENEGLAGFGVMQFSGRARASARIAPESVLIARRL